MLDNTLVREFISRLLDAIDEGIIPQKDAYKIIANAFSYMTKEFEER